MKAIRWTLAMAALGLLVAPAHAALCVKRSGALVARAECKQKETVLSADVFSGSPGSAGAAGAKGDKGEKGEKGEKGNAGDSAALPLFDSSGEQIGLVDAYSEISVLVPSGILTMMVGPLGFEPYNSPPGLYHEGTNCAGVAFVPRYLGDGFVQYPDVFSATAYYAGDPIAEHIFKSYEYPAQTCATGLTPRGFCCENLGTPYTYDAGPVRTFDLSTLGTPPFNVAN